MKNIKVLSLAKFQAIIMSIIGLILGIVYSYGGAIYDAATIGLNWGTLLAFIALLGMPFIFGIFGFILGGIEAYLLNLFSKWLKNFQIEFKR